VQIVRTLGLLSGFIGFAARDQLIDTLLHFAGRFVREGDTQDVSWEDPFSIMQAIR